MSFQRISDASPLMSQRDSQTAPIDDQTDAKETRRGGAAGNFFGLANIEAWEKTKLYDLIAGAPLTAFFALVTAFQFSALKDEITRVDFTALPVDQALSIASRFVSLILVAMWVVLLLARHVPKGKCQRLFPRIAALAGTYLALWIVALPPQHFSPLLDPIGVLLQFVGTVFAIYAALALGRSISIMPEARRLVTVGPYAVIRHPLYLGEGVALAGVTLQHLSVWAVGIFVFECAFQLQRMKNEELILSESFPEYRAYLGRTARLLPKIY